MILNSSRPLLGKMVIVSNRSDRPSTQQLELVSYCFINFNFVYFCTAFLIHIPIKMESQHCILKCRSLTHNFPQMSHLWNKCNTKPIPMQVLEWRESTFWASIRQHPITQTMSIDSLTRYAQDEYSNMVRQADFQVPLTLYFIVIPCKAL
jgi:hypothetical protein